MSAEAAKNVKLSFQHSSAFLLHLAGETQAWYNAQAANLSNLQQCLAISAFPTGADSHDAKEKPDYILCSLRSHKVKERWVEKSICLGGAQEIDRDYTVTYVQLSIPD